MSHSHIDVQRHTYMHRCMHAALEAYKHAYMHRAIHTYILTLMHYICMCASKHTCIHAYIHTPGSTRTYIHAYAGTYKGAKTRMQFLPAYTYRHKYTVSRPQALNLLVGLGEARAARRRVAGSRIPKRTDLRKPGVNLMQEVACKSLALGFDLAFLGLTLLVDLRRH